MQSPTPEPSAAEQPAEAPPPSRKPTALILVVLTVVLVAAGVGGYFLYAYLTKKPEVNAPPTVNEARKHERREVPKITFADVTAASGVNFTHTAGQTRHKLLPETMGGGVACFDYDGDGKTDILFVNSRTWPGQDPAGPAPTLKLFRNLGDWKFTDVTAAAGLDKTLYGMGVAVGDIDNDGRPDVFVSCVGKHRLFRNVDGKRFEDISDASGVAGSTDLPDVKSLEEFVQWDQPIPFGSSATFLDYDGDGRLDLFVCHYVTWSPKVDISVVSQLAGGTRTYVQPKEMDGSQCSLFRNEGGGKFKDVSEAAGVQVWSKTGTKADDKLRPVGKALGVVAWDADGDGYPEVFVANDTVRNFLFENKPGADGGRVFYENGVKRGAAYADEGKPRGGMGIDWGEFAPGRCSAVVANFANEPLTFLERDGKELKFSDSALTVGLAGPSRSSLKFGTTFFDYDNDGRLDLLVNNGHIDPDISQIQRSQSYAQPPQLFWNTGDRQCYYEPVTEASGGADLFKPLVGRGSAFADFDADGDLDVVLVANNGPARVLRNDAPATNKSVRLELKGDGTTVNRSAIGAVVTVEAGGQTFVRPVTGGRGYLSQSELPLTVGIGMATKADRVTVRWPGKEVIETWTNLDAGKPHVLEQGKAK